MALNTVVDIGKGVLFFPILENHGKRTALVYLAAIVAGGAPGHRRALLADARSRGQIVAEAGAASAAWAPNLG